MTVYGSLPPNDQDNRAEGWVESVTVNETRQRQSAPVHPFVRQPGANEVSNLVLEIASTHGSRLSCPLLSSASFADVDVSFLFRSIQRLSFHGRSSTNANAKNGQRTEQKGVANT